MGHALRETETVSAILTSAFEVLAVPDEDSEEEGASSDDSNETGSDLGSEESTEEVATSDDAEPKSKRGCSHTARGTAPLSTFAVLMIGLLGIRRRNQPEADPINHKK